MFTATSITSTTPSRARRRIAAVAGLSLVGIALAGLVGCTEDSGASPSPPPVTRPASSTTDGGGGMHAGAPGFKTFEVSGSATCESGNADVTMSYTTINAVDMEIKVGDGDFAETAGYGPNERDVIASIPCAGAGESTVQMRGCTETNECADSPVRHVTITG